MKGFRDTMGLMNPQKAKETFTHIERLCRHIEDISEAQDELAKALISVYNNQIAIAKEIGVTLPEPLVDMTVENKRGTTKNDTRT